VVAGGDTAPHAGLAAVLPRCDAVVAADSGVHHALALGLHVDVVVGDLDSARADDVARAARAGAVIERFPAEKDQTDLELALDRARVLGGPGARLVVVASVGGRLDHALANLLVLANDAWAGCSVEAFVDRWRVHLVRDETQRIATRPGATVTLLVVDAPAARVTTEGLQYPLRDEPLQRFSTRGVSNVALGGSCTVRVAGGALFVLHEWAD
jgi:thiamine pyrophosphokinase